MRPTCRRHTVFSSRRDLAAPAARAVLGGLRLPFSFSGSVRLVAGLVLGHRGHALVLVPSLVCQDAHGVQRGAGYNGRGRGQLADLQSSVAVQTWIEADRRYDSAGHAKTTRTRPRFHRRMHEQSARRPSRSKPRQDPQGQSGASPTNAEMRTPQLWYLWVGKFWVFVCARL